MKICTKCGEEKELIEYHRDKTMKDGVSARCKECKRVYYKENATRTKHRTNTWKANNKEKVRTSNADYRVKHKTDIKERGRRYYERNKEDIRIKQELYRKANPNNHRTKPYIYKILNRVTGDTYYGSSWSKYRWREHKNVMKNKNSSHHNIPLYRHMREFGLSVFIFEKVLIVNTRDRAYELEKILINKFSTLNILK
jgi:hypothetical protein